MKLSEFFSVKVKWGRETFSDVELNTDEEPMVFKAQIYALTGVIPQRQKVMIKGCVIKDDSWGAVNIAEVTCLSIKITEISMPVSGCPSSIKKSCVNTHTTLSYSNLRI